MILTINPGSTSAKYSLFIENREQRIENNIIKGHFKKQKDSYTFNDKPIQASDFDQSFNYFIQYLISENHIQSLEDIEKIGIRIVHGGHHFTKPSPINAETIPKIEALSNLAPLHNPPALSLISQIQNSKFKIPIFGVFDTAFHSTIPQFAKLYGIPLALSKKYHIQRYGFHGIACQSVLHQVTKTLGHTPHKMIICHLGGGASITAVKDGKSIDTSMGFTPLEGLMMITRSGDLDPGILQYLEKNTDLSGDEILNLLNKESGIKGITGSDDMKTIVEKAISGDPLCKLAVEMFVYRIVKYIFAYYGALQGVDIITFSGGIGVGSETLRKIICEELRILGVRIEEKKNLKVTESPQELTRKDAEKKVFVVQVDEAEEIYRSILEIEN